MKICTARPRRKAPTSASRWGRGCGEGETYEDCIALVFESGLDVRGGGVEVLQDVCAFDVLERYVEGFELQRGGVFWPLLDDGDDVGHAERDELLLIDGGV